MGTIHDPTLLIACPAPQAFWWLWVGFWDDGSRSADGRVLFCIDVALADCRREPVADLPDLGGQVGLGKESGVKEHTGDGQRGIGPLCDWGAGSAKVAGGMVAVQRAAAGQQFPGR